MQYPRRRASDRQKQERKKGNVAFGDLEKESGQRATENTLSCFDDDFFMPVRYYARSIANEKFHDVAAEPDRH